MGVIVRLFLVVATALLLGGCGDSGGGTIKPEPSKNPMAEHAAKAGG